MTTTTTPYYGGKDEHHQPGVIVPGIVTDGGDYYDHDDSNNTKMSGVPYYYGAATDSQIQDQTQAQSQGRMGSPQPHRCNDVAFAILFLAHLVAMACAAAKYVPLAAVVAQEYATNIQNNQNNNNNNNRQILRLLENDNDQYYNQQYYNYNNNNNQNENKNENDQYEANVNYYYDNTYDGIPVSDATTPQILTLVGTVGVLAMLCSSLNLHIMVHCAKRLIKAALIFNATTMVCVAIMGFVGGNLMGGIMGSFFALLAIWFACSVWSRVPFAASNLVTATTAIRTNLGVTTFAYFSVFVGFLWNLWWIATVSSFTAVKYYDQQEAQADDDDAQAVASDPLNGFIMFLFFLSYYWTYQVIKVRTYSTCSRTDCLH
jgi:hypothetical protein